MNRNAFNLLVVVFALLLSLVLLVAETLRSNDRLSLQSFDKGSALPSFSVPELLNPVKTLNDSDLKGQVCLLNFWASWCSACRREHHTLIYINRNYRIPIFGINFKDNPLKAKEWIAKSGNPYAVTGADPTGKVAKQFGVFGVPITYIIDKHGYARYRYLGILTEETWNKEILPVINSLEHEN